MPRGRAAQQPSRKRGTLRNLGIAALVLLPLAALVLVYGQRALGQRAVLAAAPVSDSVDVQQADDAEPELTAEARWLDERLTEIGLRFRGRLGIAVVDIANDRAVDFNGDTLLPQQSVSKLWVALTALDQADRGEFDLGANGTVRFADLTLFHQPIRKRVMENGSFTTTYADFMRRALVESDNTANDMLLKRVGGSAAVRAFLADKQLGDIRFGPGEREMQAALAGMEWDQRMSLGKTFFNVRKTVPHSLRREVFDEYVEDPVDGASALAIAQALARLQRGELLSAAGTRQLLTLMRDAKSGPNRLKGGLPEGWRLAHKTGTGQVLDIVPPGVIGEQTGYNDVGILTAPDGSDYAVAVMIGHTRTPVPERMDMMHEVVRAVAGYHALLTGETGQPTEAN